MSEIKKIAVSAAVVAALAIRHKPCLHQYDYSLDNKCIKCGEEHPLRKKEPRHD